MKSEDKNLSPKKHKKGQSLNHKIDVIHGKKTATRK